MITDVLERVLVEYRQWPGLRLTPAQAARLWTLPQDDCDAMLDALVASGLLSRDGDGQYALPRTVSQELWSRRRTREAVA